MSVIVQDKTKITNLQTNKSKAKMMYSFSKQNRFKK